METTEAVKTAEADRMGALEARSGRYMKVREIADYLAVSLSTVYAVIESGDLPAVAIGRGAKKALRVHQRDLLAYEQSCRVQPAAAVAA
jgi:excisionase family DNA binding protein